MSDDKTLKDEALSTLRAVYYRYVRATAEDLLADVKRGDIEDRDALMQRIDEDADSEVIYTYRAREILFLSDNEDAAINELGVDGIDWSDGIPTSQLAFFAYRQDLIDELSRMDGIEIDEDDLGQSRDEDETDAA